VLAPSHSPFPDVCPQEIDDDGDGRISKDEVSRVVNDLVNEQFRGRFYRMCLIGAGVYTVLLLGAIFGLVWAVMSTQQEVNVKNGVLLVKGSDQPVQLRNADYELINGRLSQKTAGQIATLSTTRFAL
jgi:hypothetical protein